MSCAIALFALLSLSISAVGCVRINSQYRSFSPNSDLVYELDCDGTADLSKVVLKYYLGGTVVFNSEAPQNAGSYVVNNKDGTIGIKLAGATTGYEAFSCEKDGVKSENSLTLFAVFDANLQRNPDKFELNSPIQMSCLSTVRPVTGSSYTVWLSHQGLKDTEAVVIAKLVYKQSDPAGNAGTFLQNNQKVEDFIKIVPGTDKDKLTATITPLGDKARGRYSCMTEVAGDLHHSGEWDTDSNPGNSGNLSQACVMTFMMTLIICKLFLS